MKYQNIDPVKELIPVRPVIHYMMGGVSTDMNAATPIAGLYAAGEAACVSINGANRLGSNSLPELLVFGARAGKAAADYASSHTDTSPAAIAQGKDEFTRLTKDFIGRRGGRERIATLRDELQKTMEQGAGIYRAADSLKKTVDTVRGLQRRIDDIIIEDQSRTFNTERVTALELSFMLDVAEAMANSALRREESRGAHQRSDFPKRDDAKYLKHSMAYRQSDGSCRVEYAPVTITKLPPGERKYGN
jgi:fumarate reductase flavoprotein subunit